MAEIIVDEKVRFGKPIIKGTRITVEEVLGALASGMTFKEIEQEYGLGKSEIIAVLSYATEIVAEEKIGSLKAKHEISA